MIRNALLLSLALTVAIVTVSGAASRMVLMEEFTNVQCGPCATHVPYFDAFMANHPDDLAIIWYHMSWPGYDPFYADNTVENNVRRTYYGVNAVPHNRLDAIEPANYPYTVPVLEARFTQAMAVPCNMSISLDGYWTPNSGSGLVNVTLNSEGIIGGALVMHVALVENNLYWNGTGTYDWHHYVMRDLITGTAGESLANFTGPETREFSYDYDASESWIVPYDDENFVITVWVQNNQNKQVIQSAMVPVTDFIAIDTPETVPGLVLTGIGPSYPNPFNPTTHIPIMMSAAGTARVRIYSMDGRLVQTLHTDVLPQGTSTFVWDGTDFSQNPVASGVYYVRLDANGTTDTETITMLK